MSWAKTGQFLTSFVNAARIRYDFANNDTTIPSSNDKAMPMDCAKLSEPYTAESHQLVSNPINCPLGVADCPCQTKLAQLEIEITSLQTELRTDRLTGLGNYRRFEEAIAEEWARTQRDGLPLALLIADLDHFKQVNDQHGHEVGNLALKHVAKLWRENSRRFDIVCRYGGEEIAFLLPNTDLESAIQMAERHRRRLEHLPLDYAGKPIALSASFGVAVHTLQAPLSEQALVATADRWLYAAKAAGRNCVRHPPLLQTPVSPGLSQAERAALMGPS